ncbi:MAG: ABC transporter permease, partial [Proteobacteria bacterium]
SVVQTIPSLALLCLLIPLFGIGIKPALVALCLYSLLPVIQNTLIGLQSIPSQLLETADALGLSKGKRLMAVELPLASRSILGGVRTAAIIGIGTATLAALIGAGGYGAPIISGLATNNLSLILTGAIPCAVLSLAMFGVFELATLVFVPKGLRL